MLVSQVFSFSWFLHGFFHFYQGPGWPNRNRKIERLYRWATWELPWKDSQCGRHKFYWVVVSSIFLFSTLPGEMKAFCWWTKSCTTKDDDYILIYRVLTIPGGAGFCPSTVSLIFFSKGLVQPPTRKAMTSWCGSLVCFKGGEFSQHFDGLNKQVHLFSQVVVSHFFLYVHPDLWGNDPIWLAHMFQMGWFNQPERYFEKRPSR